MRPYPQIFAELVTFNKEILNGKLHSFVQCEKLQNHSEINGDEELSLKSYRPTT